MRVTSAVIAFAIHLLYFGHVPANEKIHCYHAGGEKLLVYSVIPPAAPSRQHQFFVAILNELLPVDNLFQLRDAVRLVVALGLQMLNLLAHFLPFLRACRSTSNFSINQTG
jgi:hypothetical protein